MSTVQDQIGPLHILPEPHKSLELFFQLPFMHKFEWWRAIAVCSVDTSSRSWGSLKMMQVTELHIGATAFHNSSINEDDCLCLPVKFLCIIRTFYLVEYQLDLDEKGECSTNVSNIPQLDKLEAIC